MNREMRAKQFQPFDALKGLSEALREREERITRCARRELSDERCEEISNVLVRLSPEMLVRAIFYLNGHYLELIDRLSFMSIHGRYLQFNEQRVYFDDVYEIEILET